MAAIDPGPKQGDDRECRFLQDWEGGPITGAERYAVAAALRGIPPVSACPIRLRFLPNISASGGKLRSGLPGGVEVHAASFPRFRTVTLNRSLLEDRSELARVLVHEVFHFAWVRLCNGARWSFEDLLRAEREAKARGELGWSAERLVVKIGPEQVRSRSKLWREYACESFCDTAAYVFAGLRSHPEWTLATRFRTRRERWFHSLVKARPLVL